MNNDHRNRHRRRQGVLRQDGHIGTSLRTTGSTAGSPGRHTDGFPVTALRRPGATMDDFGTAYVAARAKTVERWPELVGVAPVR